MPPNLGGFFMVRSYYPSECHADYFDFERIEALKPAIEACGISTFSQSPMLGFHKQMANRLQLLAETLSVRVQGAEVANGEMDGHGRKSASAVRAECVSGTETVRGEVAVGDMVRPRRVLRRAEGDRDEAGPADAQPDAQGVEQTHPVDGDDLAVLDRGRPDAVDLEGVRDPQGDLPRRRPLVEVRRRGANRGRARLDPHDVPGGVHGGGERVITGPDEGDVGDLLRVRDREDVPGTGGRVGLVASDEHRKRFDCDAHRVVPLGGKDAGRECRTTEQHRPCSDATAESHALEPGGVGPQSIMSPQPEPNDPSPKATMA